MFDRGELNLAPTGGRAAGTHSVQYYYIFVATHPKAATECQRNEAFFLL